MENESKKKEKTKGKIRGVFEWSHPLNKREEFTRTKKPETFLPRNKRSSRRSWGEPGTGKKRGGSEPSGPTVAEGFFSKGNSWKNHGAQNRKGASTLQVVGGIAASDSAR